jgi:hypothetical protein
MILVKNPALGFHYPPPTNIIPQNLQDFSFLTEPKFIEERITVCMQLYKDFKGKVSQNGSKWIFC